MRSFIILGAGLASLASAAPTPETRADKNCFAVTNFVYGCTTTCDWSFSVAVPDDNQDHPAVSTPVTCSGSTSNQDYKKCTPVSSSQAIYAYIDKNNKLKLDYEYHDVDTGATYNYFGHRKVNTATSGNPQKKNFRVVESSATAIA